MKKVLVAGACGYIGAKLCMFLAERGYRVSAFDRFAPPVDHPWIDLMDDIVIGDVRDSRVIEKLSANHYDIAINLISLDHNKSEQTPNFVSSINVMPTWNLLEALTSKGLKLFIYLSTQQALGVLPIQTIDESFPPNPSNKYGLTHLLSEKIVNYFDDLTNTKCINLRLSNGYGSPVFKENNCWWLVINDLCKTAYLEGNVRLSSDGSPQRDFIHISDVCKAIETLIEQGTTTDENVFHIASGSTLTILELAHIVKKVYFSRYEKEIPIYLPDNSISESSVDVQQGQKFLLDNSRIKEAGFQLEMNLDMGINEIFDYLESQ